MICSACGTTMELRFFPVKEWVCPQCGHPNDPDDIPYEDDDDDARDG